MLAARAGGARKALLEILQRQPEPGQARGARGVELGDGRHAALSAPAARPRQSTIRARMEVIIQPDSAAVADLAARIFQRQLAQKPASVLGLATGSTPLALYRELVARNRAGEIDFTGAVTFNLDEYAGLGPEHPQSYAFFMRENLFGQLRTPPAATHLPDGLAPDFPRECRGVRGGDPARGRDRSAIARARRERPHRFQ